ncbi:MDR family MFS transporter [Pseudonocardia yunnanensis]|uniref:MFS transporter n=1 Tax=Pseudonocardia yunnanensis TaxID=58107 RepID=A0ABW4EPW6_9PSEU
MLRSLPAGGSIKQDQRQGEEPLPRRWTVFAVIAIALLMASIDQTSVATALPAIQNDLGGSLAWSSWTITVYALGQIMSMPIAGKLSDQFGRKTIFLVAITMFTVTSLCAGMAGDIATLIVVRVFQGLAAGAIVPSATGIVADQFGRDRDRAIGMFTSIFPIGAIIGPVVGGVLVTYTSWRAIFLINLPLGVLLVILVAVLIRTTPRTAAAAPIDLRGIGLLCGLLLSTMTAITALGTPGNLRLQIIAASIAAVVAAVLCWRFLRHASRDPHAVVPMRLLRGRTFGTMNTVNVMFGAAALGFGTLVPIYAEDRYGIAPLAAGGLLAIRALGMISLSGLSVFLLRRTGHRILMVAGFVLMTVGLVLLALPPQGLSPQAWLSIAAGITGLGMGMAAPASNNASLHLAPREISAITGLRGMFRQSGAIVSITVTTAVLSVSTSPGITQAYVFGVFAVILLAAVPLIISMPDHRGSW